MAQKAIGEKNRKGITNFEKNISDSYTHLENTTDTLIQKWYKENAAKSRKTLDNISGRQKLLDKFIEFEKRKSFSISFFNMMDDSTCFYLKKNENGKSSNLYFKKSIEGEETLLFEFSGYKKNSGSNYIINYIKPSWNGKFVALGFSKNGEEIGEIVILDVQSKKLLPQIIPNCWPSEFGIDWLQDDSSIIYLHIPVVDTKDANYILNTELVVYKLGDSPELHKVILSKKNNPDVEINSADFPMISRFDNKSNYVVCSLSGATNYPDYYYANMADLKNDRINWRPLINKRDLLSKPTLIEDDLYCMSSKNASNFKIIKTNIKNINFEDAEIVVPENKEETILDFKITKDGLFYTTSKNGVEAKLYFVDKYFKSKQISLPIKAGAITINSKNKYSSDFWVSLSGWTSVSKRYRYDVIENKFSEENLSPVVQYPEFEDFKVEEIEVPSHDGILIPVSLIYKKGLKKDKKNNVLLYGYGAYGTSISPRLSPIFLTWVLNDGVYVVPHVRGGGEKGSTWHKQGYKTSKSNTWKDLIATAEFLIKEKITSKERMAIYSGSAGGILVGRAITERPDLFKVMVCYNGLLNPLKIISAPNGPNTMKEFGNPDVKEEFDMIYGMDSFHQIKKGIKYPSCLVSVGMNDARVAPWMSGKFVAKLRDSSASENPILFSVDYNSGHGMDSSNLQLYNNYADDFAFAFWQLGHPKFKLKK